MTKKVNKIVIFDFDGTLVSTPLPDIGKELYEQKHGTPWPHTGWWGKSESLDMNTFDIPTIESVIEAYQKHVQEPDTLVVMLTGRMVKLASHVKVILDTHNLVFDEYHYNTGGSTEVAKVKAMESLLDKYPDVIEIEMFDDRLEHIPIFEVWGDSLVKSGRITKFHINVVESNHHDPINND